MARKDVINGLLSQDMTDANDNFIELYGEIEAARDGETSLLLKEQDQDTNIASVTNEVIAARDGEVNLLAQIDKLQVTTTEVIAARDGKASLLLKEQDQDTNIASVTNEVIAARDGKVNLLAQIDDLQAAITALLVGSGVPVTVNDTTPGYLSTKVVSTDGSIAFSVSNPGGDEKLNISALDTLATVSASANIALTSSSSVYQNISMTATGKSVILPNATTLTEGGRYIFYNSGSYNFTVLDSGNTFKALCVPGEWATLTLADNATAAGSWIVEGRTISSRLKTVLNAMGSEFVASCRLSDTRILVAWQGTDADGFCAVITWVPGTPGITVSNILEFNTTYGRPGSCCRMSDTVGVIMYKNGSSYAQACAVTFDGIDTLTVTHDYNIGTFTVSDPRVLSIYEHSTTGKMFVVYSKDSDTFTYGQVLNWTGTNITANTAETRITGGVGEYQFSAALLSGVVDSATIMLGYNTGSIVRVIPIAWNGTALSYGTYYNISQSSHGSVVGLSANSFLVSCLTTVNSSTGLYNTQAVLFYYNGTSIIAHRTIIIEISHPNSQMELDQYSVKTGPDTVCVVFPGYAPFQTNAYKIKAIVSSIPAEAVLEIVSKSFVDNCDFNLSIAPLETNGALVIYRDPANSNYLTAKRIDL